MISATMAGTSNPWGLTHRSVRSNCHRTSAALMQRTPAYSRANARLVCWSQAAGRQWPDPAEHAVHGDLVGLPWALLSDAWVWIAHPWAGNSCRSWLSSSAVVL